MASSQPAAIPPDRAGATTDDIRVQETNHRCSNDLQMVVNMLALQASRAGTEETREALTGTMQRVAVLARSRKASMRRDLTLEVALRHLCEALSAQSKPHSIQVSLDFPGDEIALSPAQITTLTMVVNELSTNAIKHGFEAGIGGYVRVSVRKDDNMVVVVVDDDGLPFPELDNSEGNGFGLDLVKQMVASLADELPCRQTARRLLRSKFHYPPLNTAHSGQSRLAASCRIARHCQMNEQQVLEA